MALKVHNSCLLVIALWFLFLKFLLQKGVQKAHTWYGEWRKSALGNIERQQEEEIKQVRNPTIVFKLRMILYALILPLLNTRIHVHEGKCKRMYTFQKGTHSDTGIHYYTLCLCCQTSSSNKDKLHIPCEKK